MNAKGRIRTTVSDTRATQGAAARPRAGCHSPVLTNGSLAARVAFLAIAVVAGSSLAFAKTQTGTAVFYSDKMDGKAVSLKGEHYDKNGLTAATHSGFPLGSMLKVTNLTNNKTVTVKVNDRMNPKSKSVVDLSRKAAEELDIVQRGHTRVRLESVAAR